MASASVVDELRRDHDLLRGEVAALERVIQAAAEGQRSSAPLLEDAFRQGLAQAGADLEAHFRREEQGLFPDAARLVAEGVAGTDTIREFLSEEAEDDLRAHTTLRNDLREMIEVLTQAEAAGQLAPADARHVAERFRLFRTVLELHAAKEDALIFPMIESALSRVQRAAVLQRLGEMPLKAG